MAKTKFPSATKLKYEERLMLKDFTKNNSIKWYEWCEATFEKAEDENKAIFIFIDYELSNLCKIMQENILNNPEAKNLLNKHFICVHVDKDEQPDLDRYYQGVHNLLNKRVGGWPLSIFCTPQNKPIFAGTYIPLESEKGSVEGMGFLEICKMISSKIINKDEKLYENADEIEEFINNFEREKEATVLKDEFYKTFVLQAKNNYDKQNGGFSNQPKFLHVDMLRTLLDIYKRFDNQEAKGMCLKTLQTMQKNNIFDTNDGGFYRYTTDNMWQNPELEKTIYDNALLSKLYIDSYEVFKDESFLQTAKKSIDFWIDNMSENALFYSAIQTKNSTPHVDKKIQTHYNAMMIDALFCISVYDNKYENIAIKSLENLQSHMYKDYKLSHIELSGKKQEAKAFLDDYAFLSLSFIKAYKITKDEKYLIDSQRLINKALELFYKDGMWYFSQEEFKTLADTKDSMHTSSVSVMVNGLLSLGKELKDDKYTHFAFKTLEYNSYKLAREPLFYSSLLKGMFRYLKIHKNSF